MSLTRSVAACAVLLTASAASPGARFDPQPPEGTLQRAPNMSAARAAHTATALANGDVLIVGGFGADESRLAGAELFDAARGRFVAVRGPQVRRQSHTATRLLDGRVLITGGLAEANQYLARAEMYDPATRSFYAAGAMTTPRAGHEAVLLGDGRVLLVGGVGPGWTFLASAEIYDPRAGTFTTVGDMEEPRESHVAVALSPTHVLVAGGHRGRGAEIVISRTAEVFDAARGTFRRVGDLGVRRHKHDAIALGDGRVLVMGGADERDDRGVYASVEVFDPREGRFQPGKSMLQTRYKHRGTTFLMPDGKLLLLGGAPHAEEYDPATGTSRFVAGDVELPGQFSAAATLPNGRVLITGGYGQGRGARANAWIYQP
jgi:hypothetical protein